VNGNHHLALSHSGNELILTKRGEKGRGRTAGKLAEAKTRVFAQCVTETRTVQRSSPVTYWAPLSRSEPPW